MLDASNHPCCKPKSAAITHLSIDFVDLEHRISQESIPTAITCEAESEVGKFWRIR